MRDFATRLTGNRNLTALVDTPVIPGRPTAQGPAGVSWSGSDQIQGVICLNAFGNKGLQKVMPRDRFGVLLDSDWGVPRCRQRIGIRPSLVGEYVVPIVRL
jgi:hypothetical protein